jgi:hypothetical protein
MFRVGIIQPTDPGCHTSLYSQYAVKATTTCNISRLAGPGRLRTQTRYYKIQAFAWKFASMMTVQQVFKTRKLPGGQALRGIYEVNVGRLDLRLNAATGRDSLSQLLPAKFRKYGFSL